MQNRLQEFYQGLDLQYAQGDLGEVEKFLITSAIRAQKSGQSGAGERIAVYNELGSFYRGAGRYALSLDAFERARTLAAGAVGENCSQYATKPGRSTRRSPISSRRWCSLKKCPATGTRSR